MKRILSSDWLLDWARWAIHHFHIDHNAPCLTPKILGRLLYPGEIGNTGNAKNFFLLGGGGEEGRDTLWSMCENDKLTTTENTITYHNTLCLSP